MRRASLCLPVLMALATLSCYPLQTLEEGVCGNGVIEPEEGEDCEPAQYEAFTCRPPGDALQCTIQCNSGGVCPRGHGCSADNTCRKPGGTFSFEPIVQAGSQAGELLAGDFDADGRDDIVAVEPGKTRIYFTDASGGVEQTTVASSLPPAVTKLGPVAKTDETVTLDTTDDLVLPLGFGIGALLSEGNRTFRSKTYGSIPIDVIPLDPIETGPDQVTEVFQYEVLGAAPLTIDAVHAVAGQASGDETIALVELRKLEEGSGAESAETIVAELSAGGIGPVFPLSNTKLSDVSGALVRGNFDDDLCEELAVPKTTSNVVAVYKLCQSVPGFAGYEWARRGTEAGAVLVSVDLGARPQGQGFAVDVSGDGRMDLLVPVAGLLDDGMTASEATELRVAYGVEEGKFHSSPPPLQGALPDNKASLFAALPNGAPLHVAFLDEGYAQNSSTLSMIDARGIWRSGSPKEEEKEYKLSFYEWYAAKRPWTDATAADINGDGALDVLASSDNATDIDVLLGNPSGFWNPGQITTEGTVSLLATGDFDGDLVQDVVFDDILSLEDSRLRISYGRTSGGPEEPLEVGGFSSVEHLAAGNVRSLETDNISEIGVLGKLGGRTAFSFFPGTASRLLQAPLLLTDGGKGAHLPLSAAAGELGGPGGGAGRNDLAVLSWDPSPEVDYGPPANQIADIKEYASSIRLWGMSGNEPDGDFDRAAAARCIIQGAFYFPRLEPAHAINVAATQPDAGAAVFAASPYINVFDINVFDSALQDIVVSGIIGRVSFGSSELCWLPDAADQRYVSGPGELFFQVRTAHLNTNGIPEVLAVKRKYNYDELFLFLQSSIQAVLGGMPVEPSPLTVESSELVIFWDGNMNSPYSAPSESADVRDFALGDIDGNGVADLLVLDGAALRRFEVKPDKTQEGELVYPPDRAELWARADVSVPLPSEGGQAILLSDADGDGLLDLALRSGSSLRVFKGEAPNATGGSTGADDPAQPRE
jgi:hypothetical protein